MWALNSLCLSKIRVEKSSSVLRPAVPTWPAPSISCKGFLMTIKYFDMSASWACSPQMLSPKYDHSVSLTFQLPQMIKNGEVSVSVVKLKWARQRALHYWSWQGLELLRTALPSAVAKRSTVEACPRSISTVHLFTAPLLVEINEKMEVHTMLVGRSVTTEAFQCANNANSWGRPFYSTCKTPYFELVDQALLNILKQSQRVPSRTLTASSGTTNVNTSCMRMCQFARNVSACQILWVSTKQWHWGKRAAQGQLVFTFHVPNKAVGDLLPCGRQIMPWKITFAISRICIHSLWKPMNACKKFLKSSRQAWASKCAAKCNKEMLSYSNACQKKKSSLQWG